VESLNPIDQIQIPVILAVMAIVATTYFLLRRVFFAPYVAVMEEREVRLEKSRRSRRPSGSSPRPSRRRRGS